MESETEKPGSLFNVLEANGWAWEDERLYAPNRTFWTEGTKCQPTPLGMLLNMRERMEAVLQNLRVSKPSHLSAKQYQGWVSDMESLANTIKRLLESQGIQ